MTFKFKKNKNYQLLCDQFHAWLVSDLRAYGVVHVDGFGWRADVTGLVMCSVSVDRAVHCQQYVEPQPWLGGSRELCMLPTSASLSIGWRLFGGAGQSMLWAYGEHVFHLVFQDTMDAMVYMSAIKRSLAHGSYLMTYHGKYIKAHQQPRLPDGWFAGWSLPLYVPKRLYQKGCFLGLMLTAKEQCYLDYFALGLTYREIALRHGVSEVAVRKVYANIKRKLNEPNLPSSQLLSRLHRRGFVPLIGGVL